MRKQYCENCGKKGAVSDFRNFGLIWTLCKKCADIPIEELKSEYDYKTGLPKKLA